jgi:Methyltransferase FkbM domain
MKIDLEGAEGRVLRGAASLLRHHRPVIYFECQVGTAARQGEASDRVWVLLEQAGYRIWANQGCQFIPVDRMQPQIVNYLAVPDWSEFDRTRPLDAAAVIAIIDRWATLGVVS